MDSLIRDNVLHFELGSVGAVDVDSGLDFHQPWTADIGKINLPIIEYKEGMTIASIEPQEKPWVLIADDVTKAFFSAVPIIGLRIKGCIAVIALSFDADTERLLKQHGIMALTFERKEDHAATRPTDHIKLIQLEELLGQKLYSSHMYIAIGSDCVRCVSVEHRMTPEHVSWFKAGSAHKVFS